MDRQKSEPLSENPWNPPYAAISWWEDQLSDAQRETFLAGRTWEGTTMQRWERLVAFYKEAHQ